MYPLVRELAIDGIPVVVSCRVLGLARQPYYRWLRSPFTDGQLAEAYLANAIHDAHRDDPEFGYRFLADEVRQEEQHAAVSDRVVWRICRDNQWWSRFGKPRRRKGSKPGTASHDDLVRRDFTAVAPNQLWLTDLTEHRTDEGKLYLCAIKDVFSNRIVGWAIDERMKARLVVAAIEMAVARRGTDVAGCILHSDRGSQGGFNRWSQHLDDGGVRWDRRGLRRTCGCIGGKSRRQVDRRWRGARTGSSSGRRSRLEPRPRMRCARPGCHPRLGSGGSATLVA
jgi:putative transposase